MLTSQEMSEDDRIVAKCYVELGYVTKEHGEYDTSLDYHRKSMEIYERIDDALSVADSHLNIAEVYKAKGELKQAMSEYEKGLTLYEDVYVEDGNKNSDSGTDVSLNSSSFCDLQHTRSLSKSDETLPHTTLTNILEKKSPVPCPRYPINGVINTSTSSLNLPGSSTEQNHQLEGVSQSTTSIDDPALTLSKRMTSELTKSLSSSLISELQYLDDTDMFLQLSSSDLAYKTTTTTTPQESDTIEICPEFLPPITSINQDRLLLRTDPLMHDTKLEQTNSYNVSYSSCFLIEIVLTKQMHMKKKISSLEVASSISSNEF
jgi:hypothetical protein